MPPKKLAVAKPQPKPKVFKARRITYAAAEDKGGGGAPSLPLTAESIKKKRQLKKALGDLYTKVAEKGSVDVSQTRLVYEALEKVLTSDLKEHMFWNPIKNFGIHQKCLGILQKRFGINQKCFPNDPTPF